MERGRGRDATWRAAERHEHDRGCFRGCVTGSDGCWRVERGEAHFGGSDAAVPPVHDDHHSGLRVLRSSGLLLYGTVRGGGGTVGGVGVLRARRCHLRAGFQQCKSFVEMHCEMLSSISSACGFSAV